VTAPKVTGIVLAGGRATRFGGSKLEAAVEGESLLALATRVVVAVATEVLVAGPALPTLAPAPRAPLRRIADSRPFGGPLVALEGALLEARGTIAIVVAGDMPSLQAPVLELLLARLEADSAVDAVTLAPPAETPGVHDLASEPPPRQVLPLAIRVETARAAAAAAVAEGDRSLVRLLDRLRSIEIPAPEWLALDPEARTLRDIDTREDLSRILGELR